MITMNENIINVIYPCSIYSFSSFENTMLKKIKMPAQIALIMLIAICKDLPVAIGPNIREPITNNDKLDKNFERVCFWVFVNFMSYSIVDFYRKSMEMLKENVKCLMSNAECPKSNV